MLTKSESRLLEELSALADGELEPEALADICARWRNDVQLRDRWHAYHLIGDVLRSDDLAATAAKDAAFVDALRARLASEPVVLAPEPASPLPAEVPARAVVHGGRRATWAWKAPAAVAAGFVAVAGVLTVVRTPFTDSPAAAGAILARSAAPAVAAQAPQAPGAQAFIASGPVVRDARLDRYLNAHKQFAGTAALGMPSGFLRNAAIEAPNR